MKYVTLFLVVITISACSTVKYSVGVNTIGNDSNIETKNCLLIPTNEVLANQLQYDEFKKYLSVTMAERGYEITNNTEEATIAVIVDYGISGPQQNQYSYTAPVFGQTGYSSSTTTGTIFSTGNTATINTSTQYTPQYGVTGYKNVQGSYITFTRYLKLVAYDFMRFKETNEEKQIWFSMAVSTGSSGDIRRVMPYMITILKPYIGRNTEKVLFFEIKEGAEDVQALINQTK